MLGQYYSDDYCNQDSILPIPDVPPEPQHKPEAGYDAERGMSQRQKNLLITFVRRNCGLHFEDIEQYRWDELVGRLNSGPGPSRTVEVWKQALAEWEAAAIARRDRMRHYDPNDGSWIPHLSLVDVKLLVALGQLRSLSNSSSPSGRTATQEEGSQLEIEEPVDRKMAADTELMDRLLQAHLKDNQECVQVFDNLTHVIKNLDKVLRGLEQKVASASGPNG